MKHIFLWAAYLLFLLNFSANAGTANPQIFTRDNIISFNYHSDIVSRNFTIEIGYIDPTLSEENFPPTLTTNLPVVFMLDGHLDFPMMVPDFFKQVLTDKIPPFIFIGIDHVVDTDGSLRRHDFTPVPDFLDRNGEGGGANQFLRFLNEELKPFIDHTFNNETTDYTLIGHSLGGLLALHSLFTQPDSFQRYIIGSPSIWWANHHIVTEEHQYSIENNDLCAQIYMFVGSEENTGEQKMVMDLKKMFRKMKSRQYSNLTLSKKVYRDENHLTVVSPGYHHAIRNILGYDTAIDKMNACKYNSREQ